MRGRLRFSDSSWRGRLAALGSFGLVGLCLPLVFLAVAPMNIASAATPTNNPSCATGFDPALCVQATSSGLLQVYPMAGSSLPSGSVDFTITGEATGFQETFFITSLPFTTPVLPSDQYDGSLLYCGQSGCGAQGESFSLVVGPGAAQNDCLFTSPTVGMASGSASTGGYFITNALGQVCAMGGTKWYGDVSNTRLNAPVIAIAATSDAAGYWLLAADGGVFTFGDAHFFGSTGNRVLNAPVVAMASTPDNGGYWLVAKDGGVFTFGDAVFHGSMGATRLNQPVDGIAVAPAGNGYWLVAGDGGVFTFTSDGFYGSMGAKRLNRPIIGMSSTPDGRGYTLVASDGGVFTFGDASFYGSLGANPPPSPIVDLAPTPGATGYFMITQSGVVYAFGSGAHWKGGPAMLGGPWSV